MNDADKTGAYQPGDAGAPAVDDAAHPLPKQVGRYRVEKVLGKGGFGFVYLAHDDQLRRLVAIKVPHPYRSVTSDDADEYLAEARTVASLDHPNIVPVHDVGSTEEFPFFIVSKFVEGTDLATRLKQSRFSIHKTVELIATIADALHYAHRKGFVHRDIKPGNILIDTNDKPFVVDFGLALKEENVGHGPKYAGTPAYMSPEQARGEGHHVNGRSDVFSLGVVFYELLTGRRPFKGGTQEELLEQITSFEARPPRQIDDGIPKEIELVCLKALSKRESERYTTAKDMADDLRHFLRAHSSVSAKSILSSSKMSIVQPTDSNTPRMRDDTLPERPRPRWLNRKRTAVLLTGASTALVLLIAVPLLTRDKSGHPTSELKQPEKEWGRAERADRNDKSSTPIDLGGDPNPKAIPVDEPRQLPPLPADGAAKLAHMLQGHTGKIRCFAFSSNGKMLASGGADRQALLWDVRTGEQHGPALRHKHPVRALAWTFDDKTLAVASWGEGYDAAIKLWNPANGQERQTLPWEDKTGTPTKADVRGVAFSPNGRLLAAGGGPLRVWDLSKQGEPTMREWQETFPSYLYGVAFSPDGKFIAAGCHDQGDNVRVWNANAAGDPVLLTGSEAAFGLAHFDVLAVVAYVNGGKYLVRITSNGLRPSDGGASVIVWEVDAQHQRFKLLDTYKIPGGKVFALASAMDGHLRVAIIQGPRSFGAMPAFGKEPSRTEVLLWDSVTKKVTSFETGHKGSITSVAFSPDGTMLVTGSEDQTAKLWNLIP